MTIEAEVMGRLIERELGDVLAGTAARVLDALQKLRAEYADDRFAFEERYSSDQSRLGFDRRLLAFLQSEPPTGVIGMYQGGGWTMG